MVHVTGREVAHVLSGVPHLLRAESLLHYGAGAVGREWHRADPRRATQVDAYGAKTLERRLCPYPASRGPCAAPLVGRRPLVV